MEEVPDQPNHHESNGSTYHSDSDPHRKTPFRFKTKSKPDGSDTRKATLHRSKRQKVDDTRRRDTSRDHEQRSHRHSKQHKRRRSANDAQGNEEPANPTYQMDAETAFRESLFDALADDEGAAFWEGVYGQPIHTFPNVKPLDEDGPGGETRQMSDEEYTAYVRQQMWEKSHQHVIEERRRREEAAKRRAEEKKRSSYVDSEREAFNRTIEQSLRKGESRRKEKAWREAWNRYTRGWENLLAQTTAGPGGKSAGDGSETGAKSIPWPVRSGGAAEVGKEEVEAFFTHAASRDASKDSLRSMLKVERVRWHPDKMQQRFGSSKIDAETLRAVVAVFQIVDAQFAGL